MGPIATPMIIATGATAVRVIASPDRTAGELSRVLIGGSLATGVLLAIGGPAPELAAGLGTLIMATALLIHGVALARLVSSALNT